MFKKANSYIFLFPINLIPSNEVIHIVIDGIHANLGLIYIIPNIEIIEIKIKEILKRIIANNIGTIGLLNVFTILSEKKYIEIELHLG